MARSKKQVRNTEVERIKTAINSMTSWHDVDNFDYSRYKVTANDVRLVRDWVKKKKEERMKSLPDEIEKNDEILRKNKTDYRMQVQKGLWKKHYPKDSPVYWFLLEQMKLEVKELDIKLQHGFKSLTPTFSYETLSSWENLLAERAKIKKLNCESNIAEIEKNVQIVRAEIAEQETVIRNRRVQVLEEMKELGMDVTKYTEVKDDSYIG